MAQDELLLFSFKNSSIFFTCHGYLVENMSESTEMKADFLPNILRKTIFIAGLLGFTGVALGAFGAHALKSTLEAAGTLEVWKTAVFYQLIHAVGLLLLAALGRNAAAQCFVVGCIALWVLGSVLFSGSLYLLALGGPRWLGPITPLGGLCFLVGWTLVAIMGLKRP